MNARPLLIAALVAGYGYLVSWMLPLPDWAAIAWKGAGVALLANWAARQGRSTNHRLLAGVLTLGATADMVLELNFVAGAIVFVLGHLLAILLYLRNRRPRSGLKDAAAGLAFVAGTVVLGFHLASPVWAAAVAVYGLFLGAMVAAALASRFRLAGLGALLFLASDLLIFARMQSLGGLRWVDVAVWLLYFSGQTLIAWGVATHLSRR